MEFNIALVHGVDAKTASENISSEFGKLEQMLETDLEEASLQLLGWMESFHSFLEYKCVECVGNTKEAGRILEISKTVFALTERFVNKHKEVRKRRREVK